LRWVDSTCRAQQFLVDDHATDFIGAAADGADLGIAVVAIDFGLPNEAVAAMNLHRLIDRT
jgi:hypothetical protein